MSIPGPHLDDAGLSDLLDGSAPAWAVQHAEACTACARRLATARLVQDRLAALVDVDRASGRTRRDEAVAAAMAARPGPVLASISRHRPVWLAAAAAAVVAVGVTAGLAASHGGGSQPVAGRSATTGVTGTSGTSQGASGAAPSDAVAALGPAAGPSQLIGELRPLLASGASAPTSGSGASPAGAASGSATGAPAAPTGGGSRTETPMSPTATPATRRRCSCSGRPASR